METDKKGLEPDSGAEKDEIPLTLKEVLAEHSCDPAPGSNPKSQVRKAIDTNSIPWAVT